MQENETLTPMMIQYQSVKKNYKEDIIIVEIPNIKLINKNIS